MSTITTIHRALIKGMALGAAELRQRARSNKENEVISKYDGQPLACTEERVLEIMRLQAVKRKMNPSWWNALSPRERMRISQHISVSEDPHSNGFRQLRAPRPVMFDIETRGFVSDRVQAQNADMTAQGPNPFVHDKPNGGYRVLPAVYASLTDKWVTNQGVAMSPDQMTTGHLNNTVKLVRESHKNFAGKLHERLGSVAKYLHNQPELVAKIEALAHEIEALDIEDVYPIWEPLVEELATRHPIERAYVETHPNKAGLPIREGFLRASARLDPEDQDYGGF